MSSDEITELFLHGIDIGEYEKEILEGDEDA
jgi:hypothetical protein